MDEIEVDKWKIGPKKDMDENLDENYIELVVRLKNNPSQRPLLKEDLRQLKKDLQDLGKWRRFKELKKDLEDDKLL